MVTKNKLYLLFIFVLTFTIYLLTSPGTTPYNHFTLLADAFLKGKLYITANAPWLEKIPINSNDFYIAAPPMSAILAIPFVFLFGKNFPQEYIAHLIGAGITTIAAALAYKITENKTKTLWITLLVGFGNIIWFMSSVGSVWYLGQTTATFFLMLAILEVSTKKRAILVGIFVGAAYLSRIHLILTAPFFLYALGVRINYKGFKKLVLFGLGSAPFLIFNACYNLARFGVIWDKGYLLIPGLSTEPWMSMGIVNIAYIPNHLQLLFLKLPKFLNNFPYLEPSWYGLAIWITTPAFIFGLAANLKETINKLAWLTILAILFVVSIRGGTGWTQFGYRYAVDFYPFLIYLTINSIKKRKLHWYHWLLLAASIFVNLWGVIMINKLHLVSY